MKRILHRLTIDKLIRYKASEPIDIGTAVRLWYAYLSSFTYKSISYLGGLYGALLVGGC